MGDTRSLADFQNDPNMTLPHRGFLVASLLCAAFASLLFLPGLPGGFVLDDYYNIVQNTALQLRALTLSNVLDAAFSAQLGGTTRVLPTLTYALDYFRGNGLDPATFKLTNIGIHAITTFILAGFLREVLKAAGGTPERTDWQALAMALVWAIHPLQVSSVLYVVQRMQTLATLFLILALWAYLRARLAQLEGRAGRSGWLLSGLLWVVAFGNKEDAILLPAYTLALELTVLRFKAEDPELARRLRRGYLLMTTLGGALFLFVVVPHFWSSGAYPTRDFSSIERLLSQGRVLCLYLWQILLPMPSQMPFYYDWLQPSRGLLHPWTTLPALLSLLALLAFAWRMRSARPLFALGVFLFFAGHFVTSNVIGLELAFEHRNHFPLIGAVLAVGDLVAFVADRCRFRAIPFISACALLVAALAGTTVVRARSWDSGLALARTSTQLAPGSVRAWNSLCVEWFELGGGLKADNPNLDKAIAACGKAADAGADSIKALTNIIAFKALRGTVPDADWDRYLERLQQATMTPDNASAIWIILNRVRDGAQLDGDRILQAIETINRRSTVKPIESAAFGYFILGNTSHPEKAYPYFAQAVEETVDPAFANSLIEDLRKEGRPEWADRLEAIRLTPN